MHYLHIFLYRCTVSCSLCGSSSISLAVFVVFSRLLHGMPLELQSREISISSIAGVRVVVHRILRPRFSLILNIIRAFSVCCCCCVCCCCMRACMHACMHLMRLLLLQLKADGAEAQRRSTLAAVEHQRVVHPPHPL